MYTPKSAAEAKPFTLPLTAIREMLYGRYETEAGKQANRAWTAFMNVLGSIHVPGNYWDNDAHTQACLDEADPHIAGLAGTIWVSENMSELIREVFAISMMRSIPTLPASSFWANAEPYWVPQTLVYPVRRLGVSTYWSTDRPLADLTTLGMNIDRVIISTAQPDMMGNDVLLDYPSAQAEQVVDAVAALAAIQRQDAVLALGDQTSNAIFQQIAASPLTMQALADACVEECLTKGLTGIELGWHPQTTLEMQQFDQLVFILEQALAPNRLVLGLAAFVRPVIAYAPDTLSKASWINLHAYGFENSFTDLSDVTLELITRWLPMVEPLRLRLVIPCTGLDVRDGSTIGYADILDQYGLSAAQSDRAAADQIQYNGIPTVVSKVGLARTLGLSGIAFTGAEHDTDDSTSLTAIGSTAAVSSDVGNPDSLVALAYVKGWSLVTGPSTWVDPDQAAIMLIDQSVPYADGGRSFVEQALTTLGA